MNTATVAYDSAAITVLPATLAARMAAPVLPRDVLIALSLRVTADATAPGPITKRVITMALGPSVDATAIPTVSNEGRIEKMTVLTPGLDYITPPNVQIVDPNRRPSPPRAPDQAVGNLATFKAFLLVRTATQVNGGNGYLAPIVTFLGGLPPAGKLGRKKTAVVGTDIIVTGCVRAVNIPKGENGLGYPAGTKVIFSGGGAPTVIAQGFPVISPTGRILSVVITDMGAGYTQPPLVNFVIPGIAPPPPPKVALGFALMAEGRPARGAAAVALGVVTAIAITDNGSGYIQPPDILIQDVAGTGAIFVPHMALERIDVVCPGTGYTAGLTAADVRITPAFKSYFPDTSDQRAPFHRLFETLIATGAQTPVYSEAPALA